MKQLFYLIQLTFALTMISCESNAEEILFQDEFEGTALNLDSWNYELGDGCPKLCGWGNNERQLYTKKNIEVRDGNLVITATHANDLYESGRITTKDKFEFTYGTLEVRAKLATGEGLWPAIWLLGANIDTHTWPACGEIDMMEYVGKEPHTIYTSLHTADSYGETINTKKTILSDIEEGFHIYKTNWTEESITFYIDDQKVYTFNPNDKNEETWPFNKPFYMLINMAIGGNFGGPAVDDGIFPKEFIIDYVRIYKNS